MTREARLHRVGSGLAPAEEGWFVVNVGEAAWLRHEHFRGACVFEARGPVVRGTEAPKVEFSGLGVTLAVLEPGRPSGLYHAENAQEGFLVLRGECVLLVEAEERPLRAWDYFHCPPETAHVLVGAGNGPCVVLMLGARVEPHSIVYPRDERALAHDAGVEEETSSPHEAYAPFAHWENGRPDGWDELPWA